MAILFLIFAIISLLFSSVHSEWYPHNYRKSEMPPYEDEVVNIGNGEHKNNNFVIESRMGSDYPWQGSSTVNVGNGRNNKNTFTFHSSEPEIPQFSDVRKTGGTTFVHRRNNSEDVVNVGYGQNNRNQINVNGKPIQDCNGGTCDVMPPRKASAGTNLQGFSLSLTFLSLLYLFLV